MFIAVIGITAAPTFISGIKEVGFMLFFAGVLSTTLPLVIGVWMGNRIFKFREHRILSSWGCRVRR